MTKWWNGSCVGFDTETDGKDPEDARIISANVTIVRPGVRPVVHDWIVQPERDIDQSAVEIHGITTEYAREHGLPREKAIEEISEALGEASPDMPVVGHVVSYDLTVVDRERRRVGMQGIYDNSGLPSYGYNPFTVLDSLVLDKALDPYRPGKGGRRLSNAAPLYGVTLTEQDAHSAGADVRASVQMLIEIARRCLMRHPDVVALYAGRKQPHSIAQRFAAVRNHTLIEMHERQVEWAAGQAVSLAAWARGNPTETDIDPRTVRGDWPLRWWKKGPS